MENLTQWRRVQRDEIARFLGLQGTHPRISLGQKKHEMHLNEIMNLPEICLKSIQNLDYSSEDFGKFLEVSKDD